MSNIFTLLIASTSHVTEHEAQTLTSHGYSRGEYGWFLYVGMHWEPVLAEIETLGDGLAGVILHARKSGCQYVLLDRDADTLPGVSTYIW